MHNTVAINACWLYPKLYPKPKLCPKLYPYPKLPLTPASSTLSFTCPALLLLCTCRPVCPRDTGLLIPLLTCTCRPACPEDTGLLTPLLTCTCCPACPRDTGLLIPLLSAIGIGSLFTDFLEGIFTRQLESLLVQMYFREKAFFWGAQLAEQPADSGLVRLSGEA